MIPIAVIIDDLFEDSEYTEPVKAFTDAGYPITHIGLKKGKVVYGKKNKTPVIIEKSFDMVTSDDFIAMLIPGGYSPDKLRSHPTAVKFVRDFVNKNKPVFSICHAPQILISANVLKNRRITGWKSIIQDIKNAGAEYQDQEVVIDEMIVSSRSPADLPAFIDACIKLIEKTKKEE